MEVQQQKSECERPVILIYINKLIFTNKPL